MMERNDLDKALLNKMEYEMSFKNGYNYVLYSDDPENLDEPTLDYTSFQSMGFHDGYEYGDYCYRVGLRFDVKPDNLLAEMDKRFRTALDRHNEYMEILAGINTVKKM